MDMEEGEHMICFSLEPLEIIHILPFFYSSVASTQWH